MMGKTHLLGGIAAGCAAATACPDVKMKGIAITAGAIGGLIPDIDHKNSTISKKIPILSWLARLFAGHRGLFHCPIFYGLLAWAAYSFLLPETDLFRAGFWGVCAGVASHLFLDACTIRGIPMFFPLSTKSVHLLPIRTNSGGEMLVRVGLVCLIACFIGLSVARR